MHRMLLLLLLLLLMLLLLLEVVGRRGALPVLLLRGRALLPERRRRSVVAAAAARAHHRPSRELRAPPGRIFSRWGHLHVWMHAWRKWRAILTSRGVAAAVHLSRVSTSIDGGTENVFCFLPTPLSRSFTLFFLFKLLLFLFLPPPFSFSQKEAAMTKEEAETLVEVR